MICDEIAAENDTQTVDLSVFSVRPSRPLSDQGKCRTGMRKKLFPRSAIPARALYQAMKAARRPKKPPALMTGGLGLPALFVRRYPIARRRKAMSRKKKRRKKARVERRVHISRSVVKIHHPCEVC